MSVDVTEKIIRARKELNMTYRELARELGVAETYIRSIERRANYPKTAKGAWGKVISFIEKREEREANEK